MQLTGFDCSYFEFSEYYSCFRTVVKDTAVIAGSLGFDSRLGKISHIVANNDSTAATFLRSCVVQALNRGDGSRYSLHASV